MKKAKRVTVTLSESQEAYFDAVRSLLESTDQAPIITDSDIICRMLVYCAAMEDPKTFVKYFLKSRKPDSKI